MRQDRYYLNVLPRLRGSLGRLRKGRHGSALALLFLISATLLVPQSVNAADWVSQPFGFTRIAVGPGDSVAASTPFEPLEDASIQSVVGEQLTASYIAGEADRVLKWDPQTQAYLTAVRYPSADESSCWRNHDGSLLDASMTILPGEGLFVENRQSYGQTLFLSGMLPLAEATDVTIHPGQNLFAYPFPGAIQLNNTSLASDGATAGKRYSSADRVTDPTDGQMSWLKSQRKSSGTWVTGKNAKSHETLMPNAAHWYTSVGRKPFVWSASRPYDAPFGATSFLTVDSIVFGNGTDAVVSLSVDSPGMALEIYFQDIGSGDTFSPLSWEIAELGIELGLETQLQWIDQGAENRPAVSSVSTRVYLVARSDIDSDQDGLPDGREIFIHGTSSSDDDTDGDTMPDGWETANQLNPLVDDGSNDPDGDGITNADEYLAGTDPHLSDAPAPPPEPPPSGKLKCIRIDPGYFYGGPYSGKSTDAIAEMMVALAIEWGANTIYFRAASPYYGAYWDQPITPDLNSEGGHGRNDLFPRVIEKAHAEGVTIIAYVEPNRMKSVWDANPEWREKDAAGNDYLPDYFPLSVFNPGYLQWTATFITELLDMGADGVDIAECDYVGWGSAATYDASANARYFAEYPRGSLGDENWVFLRRQVLTEWYEMIGHLVHAKQKEFHVTYTWASQPNGDLFDNADISDATGFSFDDLLALLPAARPDFMVAELMWQAEAARHGGPVFSASWTESAAKQFTAFVAGRAGAIVHVEVTPFSGAAGMVAPMPDDIETSMALALEHSDGADVYDMDQAYRQLYDYNGSVDTWAAVAITRAFHATYP